MLDDGAVAERRPLFRVGGAAHHPDEQPHSSTGGVVEFVVPVLDQMTAQRRVERLMHAVVMALGDTVFAVIAAQLSQEGHRLVRALVDELSEQPSQRLAEHVELGAEVGWKQVTHRDVDGEPLGIELADQLLGPRRGSTASRSIRSPSRSSSPTPLECRSIERAHSSARFSRYAPRQ